MWKKCEPKWKTKFVTLLSQFAIKLQKISFIQTKYKPISINSDVFTAHQFRFLTGCYGYIFKLPNSKI